jgi:hypothetical protein
VSDTVEIVSTFRTRFVGKHGVIIHIQESRHSHTLDTVRFDASDQSEVFWDFDLKKVEPSHH